MEKIILNKIKELTILADELKYKHLYHLREDWQILNAKISVLEDVLKTAGRSHKIAIIKDIQENFDMGLITPKEYQEQIKAV